MSLVDLPVFAADDSVCSDEHHENDADDFSIDSDDESFDGEGNSSEYLSSSEATSPRSRATNDETLRRKLFAWRESMAVKRSKVLLLVAMLVAAVVAAIAVSKIAESNEQEQFEREFQIQVDHIVDSAERILKQQIGALETFAMAITTYAIGNHLTFPFVALPFFEIHFREFVKTATHQTVALAPLVTFSEKFQWEDFSVNNQEWIAEGLAFDGANSSPPLIPPFLHPTLTSQTVHLPVWQIGPTPKNASGVNTDLFASNISSFLDTLRSTIDHKSVQFRPCANLEMIPGVTQPDEDTQINGPMSCTSAPVFDGLELGSSSAAAILLSLTPFTSYFQGILPDDTLPVQIVIRDTCGGNFTYTINGSACSYVGPGDLSEVKFNASFHSHDLAMDIGNNSQGCRLRLDVYPTSAFKDSFSTNAGGVYAGCVIAIFTFMALLFLVYDFAVIQRQKKIMAQAERTNAIVASLFPENVQQRIMEEVDRNGPEEVNGVFSISMRKNLKSFLSGDNGQTQNSAPIADLFPSVTILFADICGFTAWSSTREPGQVFTLLETLFAAFDEIAERRRVYKVETVGDCYVAVAGLPDPRKDHAVVMARFAKECLSRFTFLTKELEVELGPDTAELAVRIGLHSGPVTAGVLRGQRARFQLFGDTMNTASRMESTGKPNRIHVSKDTADLLVEAGKQAWIRPREQAILAKGKGELETFWLENHNAGQMSATSVSTDSKEKDVGLKHSSGSVEVHRVSEFHGSDLAKELEDEKTSRLVDWNTQVLARILRLCVARRQHRKPAHYREAETVVELERLSLLENREDQHVIGEVAEIVDLPQFEEGLECTSDMGDIELGEDIVGELRNYVQTIAVVYRKNSFHNFEHASHVTMSVTKLLKRIVAPDLEDDGEKNLHDHTYGITSDPLTQFAVVFAALIHDVDHTGLPNSQLVKDQCSLAIAYNNQSVAEQNSIDIAWELLMDDRFTEFRRALYTTEKEFRRFRQLVVNAVMATDIMDRELKAFRNARWDKAFATDSESLESDSTSVNRKATIVIEHIIQASDVSHTMQHWHVYQKWNELLFDEMYSAFLDGRSEKDPADNWYEGEIGFFDFYIIPLAKKLESCGVFGVSSHEYLTYAEKNRNEWEKKGRIALAEYLEKYKGRRPKAAPS